ncbi:probable G-protein coupled receptor 88 [Protobothrops mucrosquamatus]|uniref:probable G-protein coupled receptor 88 n=1 Tax=Protobothrops mucrosquamatus TaxID=103944 RepID=UPI000775E85B|nr:probable G-protein coupled receptor 88 [Protobothrops mucrosquamatus]
MVNTSSFSSSRSSRPLQLFLCHEDSLGTRLPLSLLYLLLAISGTLSNFMVIYMVFASRKLHIISNAFIVNGCIADLSVCGFWMPQEAMQGLLPSGSPTAHSESYRLLRMSLVALGLFVSLLSHLLVALNRYVLITKPHIIYQTVYQRKHATWMIGFAWLFALLLALVPPGLETWQPIQQESKNATSNNSSNYASLGIALAILSQTVLLLHCYMRIVKRVQGSIKRVSVLDFHLLQQLPFLNTTGQPPRRAQRHLSSISVLVLCLIFLLATQPLVWVSLLSFFFQPAPRGLQLSSWLLFCSLSAFNPLLYTWKNEEFRRCLRLILHGREGRTVAVAAAEASTTLPMVSPPT